MRWRRPRSVRQQIVVLTAGATAFSMVLLAVVLQLVLAHITSNDVQRVLGDRTDAVISSVNSATTGATLVVPDTQLDAGVAVYDATGRLVAGTVPASVQEDYDDLHRVTQTTIHDDNEAGRIRAVPFRTTSGAAGVVIVTERTEPYEEAERLALIVSLVTGLLTTAAAAAIAAWATHRALRPVAEMASTAADWSQHDLTRRFDLGPPDTELSALAGTLDTLLDKVSNAIRSEQRLTSELAHELRTPLTTVQGLADLIVLRDELPADARADLAEIAAASQRMATTITTLLELARHESAMVDAAQSSLVDVVAEVVEVAAPHRVAVRLEVRDLRLGLPHALAVRALTPVVENALRFATTAVTIGGATSADESGKVDLLVTDDGPGVDAALSASLFEPGGTSGTGSGAGLGLAIARRIARSAGGDVTLVSAAARRGSTFRLRLPRG